MYLSELTIKNCGQFGEGYKELTLSLNAGLNVLVGENNAGKTTIIDAIRYALGTTDSDQHEFDEKYQIFSDQEKKTYPTIKCTFSLNASEALPEDLCQYFTKDDLSLEFSPEFCPKDKKFTHFIVKNINGNVPQNDLKSLRATYLRPLRNIESFASSNISRLPSILCSYPDEFNGMSKQYCLDLFDLGIQNQFYESQKDKKGGGASVFIQNMMKWLDGEIDPNSPQGIHLPFDLDESTKEATAWRCFRLQSQQGTQWTQKIQQSWRDNLTHELFKKQANKLRKQLYDTWNMQKNNLLDVLSSKLDELWVATFNDNTHSNDLKSWRDENSHLRRQLKINLSNLMYELTYQEGNEKAQEKQLSPELKDNQPLGKEQLTFLKKELNKLLAGEFRELIKNSFEKILKNPANTYSTEFLNQLIELIPSAQLNFTWINQAINGWLYNFLVSLFEGALRKTVEDIAQNINGKLKELSVMTDANNILRDISWGLKTHLRFNFDHMMEHISKYDTETQETRGVANLDSVIKLFCATLTLESPEPVGLGSNNLIYMATELLLLKKQKGIFKLLLIEEPEAHLHPQLQLKLMKYLDKLANEKDIQIIVTTHSPNLASAVKLENMMMIQNGQAFSLAEEKTRLQGNDYGFLERFLDVSKANLFFARGVLIVEGIAEEILLPTLAKLIGRDLTDHGVSIVNVGGTGLGRYARIFQRAEGDNRQINIPVACVTDMDVMPDCAKGKIRKKGLKTKTELTSEGWNKKRETISLKADGQNVKTFIANEWTLEYDLAYFGHKNKQPFISKQVFVAAKLAIYDTNQECNPPPKKPRKTTEKLSQKFGGDFNKIDASSTEELATEIYKLFANNNASKSIAAQYLADALENDTQFTEQQWREILPPYLIKAIDYAAGKPS